MPEPQPVPALLSPAVRAQKALGALILLLDAEGAFCFQVVSVLCSLQF